MCSFYFLTYNKESVQLHLLRPEIGRSQPGQPATAQMTPRFCVWSFPVVGTQEGRNEDWPRLALISMLMSVGRHARKLHDHWAAQSLGLPIIIRAAATGALDDPDTPSEGEEDDVACAQSYGAPAEDGLN